MDLTHGDVLDQEQKVLSNVPMYISASDGYRQWGGCLHLKRDSGELLQGREYRIALRDGRLGSIAVRKVVTTNGAHHLEVLFEGLGKLEQRRAG